MTWCALADLCCSEEAVTYVKERLVPVKCPHTGNFAIVVYINELLEKIQSGGLLKLTFLFAHDLNCASL